MKKEEFGTRFEISLEKDSIVQQPSTENFTLSNCYLMKVFNTVTKFYHTELTDIKREMQESSLANLKNNTVKDVISSKTQKRVNRALYAWSKIVEAYNKQNKQMGINAKKRLIMITLTLPTKQTHDDKYIKRNVLGYFITQLERHKEMKHYFWRAEAQNNGNIHFHFITDVYIPYIEIRQYWNNCLKQNGYIDLYEQLTGKKDPPSTHVKEISGSDSELYYSLKYVSKNEEKRPIDGYSFGYSDSLRNIYIPIIRMNDTLQSLTTKIENALSITTITDEYFSVYFVKSDAKPPKEYDQLDTIMMREYEMQVDILY